MDFFRGCTKKYRAWPFSKATCPGLVHEKCFLGALHMIMIQFTYDQKAIRLEQWLHAKLLQL